MEYGISNTPWFNPTDGARCAPYPACGYDRAAQYGADTPVQSASPSLACSTPIDQPLQGGSQGTDHFLNHHPKSNPNN